MTTDLNLQVAGIKDDYKYGFRDSEENYSFKSGKGLTREIVCQISEMKNEPGWMRDFRLKALDVFNAKPMPNWGGDLSHLNFDDIHYYMKAADRQGKSWDDVPAEIKRTFDKLGIPEAERKFLAGVGAQYESEVVYHSLRAKTWQKKGRALHRHRLTAESASTPTSCASISARSSRSRTTSSQRSTRRYGAAARSCTFPRA